MAGCGDAVFYTIRSERASERAPGVQQVYKVEICQYLDHNLQGDEQGRMELMHEEFGRWTH